MSLVEEVVLQPASKNQYVFLSGAVSGVRFIREPFQIGLVAAVVVKRTSLKKSVEAPGYRFPEALCKLVDC